MQSIRGQIMPMLEYRCGNFEQESVMLFEPAHDDDHVYVFCFCFCFWFYLFFCFVKVKYSIFRFNNTITTYSQDKETAAYTVKVYLLLVYSTPQYIAVFKLTSAAPPKRTSTNIFLESTCPFIYTVTPSCKIKLLILI